MSQLQPLTWRRAPCCAGRGARRVHRLRLRVRGRIVVGDAPARRLGQAPLPDLRRRLLQRLRARPRSYRAAGPPPPFLLLLLLLLLLVIPAASPRHPAPRYRLADRCGAVVRLSGCRETPAITPTGLHLDHRRAGVGRRGRRLNRPRRRRRARERCRLRGGCWRGLPPLQVMRAPVYGAGRSERRRGAAEPGVAQAQAAAEQAAVSPHPALLKAERLLLVLAAAAAAAACLLLHLLLYLLLPLLWQCQI